MDRDVGLDLYARLDPGRCRIDDRHAGEHVLLVDAIPELGRGDRQLGAGIDAERSAGVGADPRSCAAPGLDDVAHAVGEIELALGVVRLEPLQRRPEMRSVEDVDRRVELSDRALLGGCVAILDDLLDRAVRAPHDSAIRKVVTVE